MDYLWKRNGLFQAYRHVKQWEEHLQDPHFFEMDHDRIHNDMRDEIKDTFDKSVSESILLAMDCMYWRMPPSTNFPSSQLYNDVKEDMRLECPDIVLLLTLCLRNDVVTRGDSFKLESTGG